MKKYLVNLTKLPFYKAMSLEELVGEGFIEELPEKDTLEEKLQHFFSPLTKGIRSPEVTDMARIAKAHYQKNPKELIEGRYLSQKCASFAEVCGALNAIEGIKENPSQLGLVKLDEVLNVFDRVYRGRLKEHEGMSENYVMNSMQDFIKSIRKELANLKVG